MNKRFLFLFIFEAVLCQIHAQDQLMASRVEVNSPMILETMDTCLKVIKQCQFYKDGIPSQVLIEYDYRRSLYRCKILPQSNECDWDLLTGIIRDKSTERIPHYCYYHDILFIFIHYDTTIFGRTMEVEEIPYNYNSKFYLITEEKDSVQYESSFLNALMAEDVRGYVYCKPNESMRGNYSISSIPCPCVNDLDVLIDNSIKKVFSRRAD